MNLEDAIYEYCLKNGKFSISDGNYVSSWIDLYPLTCSRKFSDMITESLSRKLFSHSWKFDYVAGKELHGSLLASNLINKCKWLDSDLVIVRKEDNVIKAPCELDPNLTKCILVDEIISSGVNMESSIKTLINAGFEVTGILSVVYRGGGAEEKAEGMGIPFDYLYKIPEEVL
jgi:orotate phosphoribosyltransferase